MVLRYEVEANAGCRRLDPLLVTDSAVALGGRVTIIMGR
jgi:hypothetical protein